MTGDPLTALSRAWLPLFTSPIKEFHAGPHAISAGYWPNKRRAESAEADLAGAAQRWARMSFWLRTPAALSGELVRVSIIARQVQAIPSA